MLPRGVLLNKKLPNGSFCVLMPFNNLKPARSCFGSLYYPLMFRDIYAELEGNKMSGCVHSIPTENDIAAYSSIYN